ncbi:MAG: lysophospholipid acyltransferase family protein [Candidatus Aminicenantales bacterium]
MNRALETVRSLALWGVAYPAFLLSCLAIFLTAAVCRGPKLEALIKFCCRTVLSCAGVHLTVHGRENFDPSRRYIIMMNHVSILDPLVFYARFPGRARAVEEASHFHWPVYGWMIQKIGQIPIDRENPRKAMASLARAAAFIRNRKTFSFVVLPEGTRTLDGKIKPFKRGGFLLAREAGLDILPIVQAGAFRLMRKGSRLLRPGWIDYYLEPPVACPGPSKEDLAGTMEMVRAAFLRRTQ